MATFTLAGTIDYDKAGYRKPREQWLRFDDLTEEEATFFATRLHTFANDLTVELSALRTWSIDA